MTDMKWKQWTMDSYQPGNEYRIVRKQKGENDYERTGEDLQSGGY